MALIKIKYWWKFEVLTRRAFSKSYFSIVIILGGNRKILNNHDILFAKL